MSWVAARHVSLAQRFLPPDISLYAPMSGDRGTTVSGGRARSGDSLSVAEHAPARIPRGDLLYSLPLTLSSTDLGAATRLGTRERGGGDGGCSDNFEHRGSDAKVGRRALRRFAAPASSRL